jgi:hypothetical protein
MINFHLAFKASKGRDTNLIQGTDPKRFKQSREADATITRPLLLLFGLGRPPAQCLRRHPERSEGSPYFVVACFTSLPVLKLIDTSHRISHLFSVFQCDQASNEVTDNRGGLSTFEFRAHASADEGWVISTAMEASELVDLKLKWVVADQKKERAALGGSPLCCKCLWGVT